jgi:hypothetical protein
LERGLNPVRIWKAARPEMDITIEHSQQKPGISSRILAGTLMAKA